MMMTNKILIEEVDELKMCFHEVKWRYHLFGHVYGRSNCCARNMICAPN